MKSSELHRIILRNGRIGVRTCGSHRVYRKDDEVYVFACHGSKEMGDGLRLKTIKKMQLKML
jgi:mRNA interferase HicA